MKRGRSDATCRPRWRLAGLDRSALPGRIPAEVWTSGLASDSGVQMAHVFTASGASVFWRSAISIRVQSVTVAICLVSS